MPWGRIAGAASLMSAGRENLMQKRAGEVFPSPYRKLEIEFVSEIRKRKGAGAMSSGKVKGKEFCVCRGTVSHCPMKF